jgi:hypothetical protein
MKTQTREEMIEEGASEFEARGAIFLMELLKPGLKIKANGRVDTAYGDKTALGLYRAIKGMID